MACLKILKWVDEFSSSGGGVEGAEGGGGYGGRETAKGKHSVMSSASHGK